MSSSGFFCFSSHPSLWCDKTEKRNVTFLITAPFLTCPLHENDKNYYEVQIIALVLGSELVEHILKI